MQASVHSSKRSDYSYFSLFDHSLTSEWAAGALKVCAMITYSIDSIDNDHLLLQTMLS